MSAESPKQEFETNIDRKIVRFTRAIGERSVVFSFDDTTLYDFPEPFEHFRHTFTSALGKPSYIFNVGSADGLFEELDSLNFPKIRIPYPTIDDERMRLDLDDKLLEIDLQRFEKGETE